MKGKDKNGKDDLSDFLRYSNGEMSDGERNAFERELQKDPFAEEAAEGFSGMRAKEVRGDMIKLQRQLKTRITSGKRFMYYRIAASVAVLMIISSVFIVVNRNEKTKVPGSIKENAKNPPEMEIPESKAIIQPEIQKPKDNKSSPELTTAVRTETIKKSEPVEQISAGRSSITAEKKSEPVVIPVEKADKSIIEEKHAAAPVAVINRQRPPELTVSGRIISSEDNKPIAGVSVMIKGKVAGVITDREGNFKIDVPDDKSRTLVASFIGMKPKEFEAKPDQEIQINMEPDAVSLSEVVVVGYGVARSNATGAAAYQPDYQETGYSPPQPSEGKNKFNRYIEQNIKIPETLPKGEKAVVVLSFVVNTDGIIDSIKVIKSPGLEFSNEAKRLLLEGPTWKPAVSKGEKIDEEVRLRITFK